MCFGCGEREFVLDRRRSPTKMTLGSTLGAQPQIKYIILLFIGLNNGSERSHG